MFSESGWHNPPPQPPRDYAEEDPPHRGLHPVRRGLAAVWAMVGVVLASPLIAAFAIAFVWWRVMRWITTNKT